MKPLQHNRDHEIDNQLKIIFGADARQLKQLEDDRNSSTGNV